MRNGRRNVEELVKSMQTAELFECDLVALRKRIEPPKPLLNDHAAMMVVDELLEIVHAIRLAMEQLAGHK